MKYPLQPYATMETSYTKMNPNSNLGRLSAQVISLYI